MTRHYTIDDGFVPLFRQFQNRPEWQEKRVFSKAEALISLLFKINYHEDTQIVNSISVEFGEILTSNRKLAGEWGWSYTKVRDFLRNQEKNRTITQKINQSYTIISFSKSAEFYYWKNIIKEISKKIGKKTHSNIQIFKEKTSKDIYKRKKKHSILPYYNPEAEKTLKYIKNLQKPFGKNSQR